MKKWAKNEFELAKLMRETGHSYEDIAECLDRTYNSVYTKLWTVNGYSPVTPKEVINNFVINQDPKEMENPQLELDDSASIELEPNGKYHDDILLMIRKSDLMISTLEDSYQKLKDVRRHNDHVLEQIEGIAFKEIDNGQKLVSIDKSINWLTGIVGFNVIALGALAWIILS